MIRDIVTANENIKPNSKEIQVLKENFPACFDKDGNFDVDRFKEYLSDKLTVKNEGYELRFLGKNYSRLLASLDTETVIEPDAEHNAKSENANSQNIYISGDNLDGLKQLLKSYSGSVKCIYIDPPYNTGSDGFVYNDKFNFTAEQISERLSISDEQAAKILDLARRGSASHSAWLMFMYPRLQLARDLLSNDGVIFISIDDNEQANLKLICDDVFGEENCLGIITNVNNPKGRSDDDFIATAHEYICVYARNIALTTWYGFEPTESIIRRYNKTDNDGAQFRDIDLRKTGENDLREDRPNLFYYFYYNEETGDFYPSKNDLTPEGYIQIKPLREDGAEGNWRWEFNTSCANIQNIYPKYMPVRKIWGIMQKDYLEGRSLVKPVSAWTFKDVNSERGTEAFVNLGFDKRIFPKPKPVGTISRCMELSTSTDDIILDFFSGSGTTAHAVMAMNAKDGGNRKYIMVQLQEPVQSGSEAEKAGYKTIDEIGIERIKRAAKKILEEYPDTTADLGFKHYTLREVPQGTIDKLQDFSFDSHIANDNLLETFGENTVLATYLVRDGYGFNADYETLDLAGYKAYYIKNHLYLLSGNFTNEALAELEKRFDTDPSFNPQNMVLFAYSFDWLSLDQLKTNLRHLKDTEKNLRLNFDMRY